MAVQRDNPYPNHNFEVNIVGVADDLGFSEVELPSGEIEVIEYREGRDATHRAQAARARHVPERDAEAGHQRLPRALQLVEVRPRREPPARDVSIKLLDEQRQEVMRWI